MLDVVLHGDGRRGPLHAREMTSHPMLGLARHFATRTGGATSRGRRHRAKDGIRRIARYPADGPRAIIEGAGT